MPNIEILIETAKEDLPIPYPCLSVGVVGNLETAKLVSLYLKSNALDNDQFVIVKVTDKPETGDKDGFDIIEPFLPY
jgi:hypothetical protein